MGFPQNETKTEEMRSYFSQDWGIYRTWLRLYSQAMKDWLGNITEGRPETQGLTIPVIFSTPERALADFLRPRVEGQVDLPVITFALTTVQFDQDRFRPTFLPWMKTQVGEKWQLSSKPMPWEISYNVSVFSKFYETFDLLSYAWLSRFTPLSYVFVNGASSPVRFVSQNDSSKLEGQTDDRVLRHDFSFKIEGWMPMPYREVGRISQVLVWITDELNGLNPDGSVRTIDDVITDAEAADHCAAVNSAETSILFDFNASAEVNNGADKIPGVYTVERSNPGDSSLDETPKILEPEWDGSV